jgi:pimeloyl-ACP methyl ester carboxylesterase
VSSTVQDAAVKRVLIVPGLAVRGYANAAQNALVQGGLDAELLDPPAWRTVSADLEVYGRRLGQRICAEGAAVDVLVGLSVGTQAAAVAAAVAGDLVHELLLVSPTVEPAKRSRLRLLSAWLRGENHRDSPALRNQVRDWRRAGAARIVRGFSSAVRVPLEEVLPQVRAAVTIVHAEADRLSAHSYAAGLADCTGARLLLAPDAPHSWPTGDASRFVILVSELAA